MESEYFKTGTNDKTLTVDEEEKVRGQSAPNPVPGRTIRSLKMDEKRIDGR